MYGINLMSILPLRSEASEESEQLTQLLFGEYFLIDEWLEKWVHIENVRDNERGWIDRKMMTPIDEVTFRQLCHTDHVVSNAVFSYATKGTGEQMPLPGGAVLPFYDMKKGMMNIAGNQFAFPVEHIAKADNNDDFVAHALSYLYAPYLWGGKTIMGIDCSGLVQVAASMCGVVLPRNARQQVMTGTPVNFLSEAQRGDLVFFDHDDGYIGHVGILLSDHEVLHASGQVHVAPIDHYGIRSVYTGTYSHVLRAIRRVL
jgi:hypothetical protein